MIDQLTLSTGGCVYATCGIQTEQVVSNSRRGRLRRTVQTVRRPVWSWLVGWPAAQNHLRRCRCRCVTAAGRTSATAEASWSWSNHSGQTRRTSGIDTPWRDEQRLHRVSIRTLTFVGTRRKYSRKAKTLHLSVTFCQLLYSVIIIALLHDNCRI